MTSPSGKAGGRSRLQALTVVLGAGALMLMATLAWSAAALAGPGGDNSTATISGSLSDHCRDFAAHSSKDISHVEFRYADGRVVKDERIDRPDYSIDGVAGAEIDFAIVKSGTTRATFTCAKTNSPPTATFEIETPPLTDCRLFPFPEYPTCLATTPRTVWSRPPAGVLAFAFMAPYPSATFTFRGTSSTDPESDIVSWSIDFGDGSSTSGSWATEPPTAVAHTYSVFYSNPSVTLTVTDSAGHSDSDTITVIGFDITPD